MPSFSSLHTCFSIQGQRIHSPLFSPVREPKELVRRTTGAGLILLADYIVDLSENDGRSALSVYSVLQW